MATASSLSASTSELPQNAPPPSELVLKVPDFITLPPGTALVRYQALEEIGRPRISVLLRIQLMAVSLCVVVAFYFISHLLGYQRTITDITAGEHRSIESLNAAASSEQKSIAGVNESLEQVTSKLADATADTAARFGGLDARFKSQDVATRQLADRLNKMEAEHATTIARTSSTSIQPVPRLQEGLQNGGSVSVAQTSGESSVTSTPASPSSPHMHTPNMNLPLVKGAVVHTNHMNEQDYWLIPKELSPSHEVMVRVFPLATVKLGNKTGIAVHSIDDGRDYGVTSDGEWVQAGTKTR